MTVLFSASEVGSARALIPICYYCAEVGIPFYVVKHGYFSTIYDKVIEEKLVACPKTEVEVDELINELAATTVVFSANVKDTRPLLIARRAAKLGLPTIHVLDFWNGYRSRMELDGLDVFEPSIYTVPDKFAAENAISEGIVSSSIRVVGQPAFYDAEQSYFHSLNNINHELREVIERNQDKKLIMFVSEPVEFDQGTASEGNDNYRGYTERDALDTLLRALEKNHLYEHYYVCAFPHPREDPDRLKSLWNKLGGRDYGEVITGIRGRNILPYVNGVAGMSSTLLYEAWLINKPVLSIQPGLKNNSMWMMEYREGITLIDKYTDAIDTAYKWIEELQSKSEHRMRDDIKLHIGAPRMVCELIKNLGDEYRNSNMINMVKK